ncbi:hypothetical protein BH23BAC1_BH23BAC1_38070 [soil metagenome]
MNSFYNQPKILQWLESIILCLIGLFPVLYFIDQAYSQLSYYFLFLIYVPVAQFSVSPISKLTGIYHYYSPMLSAFIPTEKEIELHSGTSFDYLFIMRKYSAGIRFRYVLIYYFMEGLLKIIESIESKEIPDTVKIVGTSYFFSQSTATKLAFSIKDPSILDRVNFILNFPDLLWMYSLSQGKFSIPNVLKLKKIVIDGKTLCNNKNKITDIYIFLKGKVM